MKSSSVTALKAMLLVSMAGVFGLQATAANEVQPQESLAKPGRNQTLDSPDQVPEGLQKSDWHSIRAAHSAWQHQFHPVDGRWQARNPGQGWSIDFDGRGFLARPDDAAWTWGLKLQGVGFGSAQESPSGTASTQIRNGRLIYQWSNGLEEWFVNDSRGLEHGFTLAGRPEGARVGEALAVTLSTLGELEPSVAADAQTVYCRDAAGAPVLNYAGLKVWDADGKVLNSRFEHANGNEFRILVEEEDARYPLTIDPIAQQAFLKAGNNGGPADDIFGYSVSVSGDTVVIGAYQEDSSTTGVNSTPNESATNAGAAYVFVRSGTTWSQQAYLKASNAGADDRFGYSVSVSGDTVVVGATVEDSSTTGVNSTPNESATNSGAAYVFVRSGTTWSQQAFLKASNTGASDQFGYSVAVSGDTVVVGSTQEASNTTGVNSTPNELASASGAAYVFFRSGTTWSQQSYLKASNTGANDQFGLSVSVSGETVLVGAYQEDSSATGVNGVSNESASNSGAAYAFVRSGTTWSQQAYLKASNTGANDQFGFSVSISGDTAVIGSNLEDSSTTGINPVANELASSSGAAYVFVRSASIWSQQAYMKASNTGANDQFGSSVSISGNTVVVGAFSETSNTTGVNGSSNELADTAGAAYAFVRSGTTWSQQAFFKASNTGVGDRFGHSVSVSGDTVVVGALREDSSTTGVNSVPDEGAVDSGAGYIFFRSGSSWSQQAFFKASNARINQGAGDNFGLSVSVSGDTVVIGAEGEASSTTGVNSAPNENAGQAGAAYVFVRNGTTWAQQAYLKASNTGAGDRFGGSVSVSGDTIVVGARSEASSTTGVNSTPNESATDAGAAYVFVRSGTTWSQQAYLKASNPGAFDLFGTSVSVSGNTVVVGARDEASTSTGIDSIPNEGGYGAGAAYVFIRNGTIWSQQAYLKASNTGVSDQFGNSVSVSGDTVVIGADREASSTTGVNSTPNDSANAAGAVYVFIRNGTIWSQQAYLKASNAGAGDQFGISVSVSGDTVVVGAVGEGSGTVGVNTTPNESASSSGAAYVFVRSGMTWSQQAYLKASNTGAGDSFGISASISGDTLVVGAHQEDGSSTGINRTPDDSASNAGAAYVYVRSGTTWSQQAYLKASNTGLSDAFGRSVSISGDTVVAGATSEDSSAAGVDLTPDEGASASGAAYILSGFGPLPPDIALEAPSGTAVSNGGGTLSFGHAAPGQSSDRTLTLRNVGGGDLESIVASITGDDASLFSVTTAPPSTLAGGGSASFAVRFSPTALGTKTATLSIASTDPDENPFTLTLTGTGNTPPTFAGYSVSTSYQTASTISRAKVLAKAADAEGQALTLSSVAATSAQGGTAVLQSGSILYSPPVLYSGVDTFNVTINDSLGGSVTGTVTVTISAASTAGGQGVNTPVLSTLPGGNIGIAFQGIPGRAYLVQRSDNLSNWATLATVTASETGAVTFTDAIPPPGSAFYRLAKP